MGVLLPLLEQPASRDSAITTQSASAQNFLLIFSPPNNSVHSGHKRYRKCYRKRLQCHSSLFFSKNQVNFDVSVQFWRCDETAAPLLRKFTRKWREINARPARPLPAAGRAPVPRGLSHTEGTSVGAFSAPWETGALDVPARFLPRCAQSERFA